MKRLKRRLLWVVSCGVAAAAFPKAQPFVDAHGISHGSPSPPFGGGLAVITAIIARFDAQLTSH